MATVLEIIQGISQVMANSYDGATEEDGKRKQTGLKRDEEVSIRDRRVIDGFTVKMRGGNKMCVAYTTEVLAKDILESKGKFEDMLLQNVSDIVDYIKKEFRKATGSTLSLTEIKEEKPTMEVIQTSRIRTEAKMIVHYEIGGLDDVHAEKDSQKEKVLKGMEKWLSLVSEKKPENDTRKE